MRPGGTLSNDMPQYSPSSCLPFLLSLLQRLPRIFKFARASWNSNWNGPSTSTFLSLSRFLSGVDGMTRKVGCKMITKNGKAKWFLCPKQKDFDFYWTSGLLLMSFQVELGLFLSTSLSRHSTRVAIRGQLNMSEVNLRRKTWVVVVTSSSREAEKLKSDWKVKLKLRMHEGITYVIPPKQVVFPLSRAIYLFGSIPAVKSIRFDVEATARTVGIVVVFLPFFWILCLQDCVSFVICF